jgi:hypothetical protein
MREDLRIVATIFFLWASFNLMQSLLSLFINLDPAVEDFIIGICRMGIAFVGFIYVGYLLMCYRRSEMLD